MTRPGWMLLSFLACAALSPAAEDPVVFKAGFAEVDITPPIGTPKQGSNTKNLSSSVLDPLYARAAVFELGRERVAIVQLDTALILSEETAAIRKRVEKDSGLAPERVMVAATHNHAGPALIDEALPRDEKVVAMLVERAAAAVAKAIEALKEAQIASGTAFEFDVAFNRRILMRDGSVRTHGSFKDPNALGFEGPIDPEVAVLAVRGKDGKMLGALCNFACHPTHHWNDGVLSAGFPGVVASRLKEKGIPIALYLQGAAGNMHHQDPRGRPEKTMEEIGKTLAEDVLKALETVKWTTPARLGAKTKVLELAYRKVSEADLQGTSKGTQRFGEKGYYDRKIPELLEKMKKGTEPSEVQVFRLGDLAFASQPSESFAELGLRIKEATWPVRTWVVGYANGMLGYIPHQAAFRRGGYECTFGPPSLMAPEVGEQLADAAIELIREK